MRRVPTGLAVASIALMPALGWQAGLAHTSGPVSEIVSPPLTAHQTRITKQALTWAHKKSDRVSQPNAGNALWSVQPETVVEVIPLDGSSPADGNEAELAALKAQEEQARRWALQTPYQDWLAQGAEARSVAITDFTTQKISGGRKSCQQHHAQIADAYGLSASQARVLADRPILFQSKICAANGEIIITCHGSKAVLSPRRARPGSSCKRT